MASVNDTLGPAVTDRSHLSGSLLPLAGVRRDLASGGSSRFTQKAQKQNNIPLS